MLKKIIEEFTRQKLILCAENLLSINKERVRVLQLWMAGVREILQRYYITVSILQDTRMCQSGLRKSQSIAQRLSYCMALMHRNFR